MRQQLFDPIGALGLVGEMKLDVIINVNSITYCVGAVG